MFASVNVCVDTQTLRVGWEQLLTTVARCINEVEIQASIFVHNGGRPSLCGSYSLSLSVGLSVDSARCRSDRCWLCATVGFAPRNKQAAAADVRRARACSR